MNFYASGTRNGFTLVELLVAISIIAVLSGIAIASYNQAGKNARDKQRLLDMKQVEVALEFYRSEKGSYPPAIGSGWNDPINQSTFASLVDVLNPDYISVIPVDPLQKEILPETTYISDLYRYNASDQNQGYVLITKFEGDRDYSYCYITGGTRTLTAGTWPSSNSTDYKEELINHPCNDLIKN